MNLLKLLLSLGMCYSVAALGSIFTFSSLVPWYSSLQKPFFTPPNSIFGPVWTILYTVMGVALYIVWISDKKKSKKNTAIKFFMIQLFLNFLWSVVFFGMRTPEAGFITILLLWGSILLTITSFHKVSPFAAYLLVPYLIWVSYASLLNLFVVILN